MIRKLLLFCALIGLASLSNAQSTTYRAFKIDFDGGDVTASNDNGGKETAALTIEPHYRLSDKVAIGLRFESAGLSQQTNSFCGTAEYYINNSWARPFIGAGAGWFLQSSTIRHLPGTGGYNTFIPGSTNFGCFPRFGLEIGHFRTSLAYNVVKDEPNYFNFTLGFFLGGGKK